MVSWIIAGAIVSASILSELLIAIVKIIKKKNRRNKSEKRNDIST